MPRSRPVAVADPAIPHLDDLFGPHVELVRRPGTSISRTDLARAEILLVRTVTRVSPELLDGTPVRFVGSPAAGTDHVDVEGLRSRGIVFAHAPGANAEAVAQWVVTALLFLSDERGLVLPGKVLGVVGRGHVGSRVARYGRALGMTVLVNDPPLERVGDQGPFVPLGDLLALSDWVTLHVPLTREGPDRTEWLLGPDAFARLRPSAFLLNSSRGEVVDEDALLASLAAGRLAGAALDVFAGEPDVDPAVVRAADLATPHIAGYSVEAKAAASLAVYRAAAAIFGWPAPPGAAALAGGPPASSLLVPPEDPAAALAATGLLEVSQSLRANPGEFTRLRASYRFRREIFRLPGYFATSHSA
ncbi:MAG: 4-phosphoerythronate dehydrogenase [Planctomycetes bacterium]|nr:4-phosphoerythronate dehydrogenase [Planctomycetota bacterium]